MRKLCFCLTMAVIAILSVGCGGNLIPRPGTAMIPHIENVVPNYQASRITVNFRPLDGYVIISGGNYKPEGASNSVFLQFSLDGTTWTNTLQSQGANGRFVVFVRDVNCRSLVYGDEYFITLSVTDSYACDFYDEPWTIVKDQSFRQ